MNSNSRKLLVKTRTGIDLPTVTVAGTMLAVSALMLGLFTALAATSLWNLGQTPGSSFGYEIHSFGDRGDFGFIYNLTHEPKTIYFYRSERGLPAYSSPPVVIAKPLSFNGSQPCHIRLDQVTSNSFQIRAEEWDYLDVTHAAENVSFIVLPAGRYDFGSFKAMAGTVTSIAGAATWTDAWKTISSTLRTDLGITATSVAPVVFTQSQTRSDTAAVVTRNTESLDIPPFTPESYYSSLVNCSDPDGGKNYYQKADAQKTLPGGGRSVWNDKCLEKVIVPCPAGAMYVGRTCSKYQEPASKACSGPNCFMQEGFCTPESNLSNIAYVCPNGCSNGACVPGLSQKVLLQEQESLMVSNKDHGQETVGWIAFSPAVAVLNNPEEGRNFNLEIGTVNNINNNFGTLAFSRNYGDPPVFLADMQTFNGPDSSGLRYQNLTADSVQIKVEEETSNDSETNHANEIIGYIAIERFACAPGFIKKGDFCYQPIPASRFGCVPGQLYDVNEAGFNGVALSNFCLDSAGYSFNVYQVQTGYETNPLINNVVTADDFVYFVSTSTQAGWNFEKREILGGPVAFYSEDKIAYPFYMIKYLTYPKNNTRVVVSFYHIFDGFKTHPGMTKQQMEAVMSRELQPDGMIYQYMQQYPNYFSD